MESLGVNMTGCRRQCDWDENMVCRSCGKFQMISEGQRNFHNFQKNVQKGGQEKEKEKT